MHAQGTSRNEISQSGVFRCSEMLRDAPRCTDSLQRVFVVPVVPVSMCHICSHVQSCAVSVSHCVALLIHSDWLVSGFGPEIQPDEHDHWMLSRPSCCCRHSCFCSSGGGNHYQYHYHPLPTCHPPAPGFVGIGGGHAMTTCQSI